MTSTATSVRPRSVALIGVSHRAIRLGKEVPPHLAGSWQVRNLWDVDARRFDAYRQAYPAHTAQTWVGMEALRRMLVHERPDLAYIATRDAHHAEGIIACLEAGVPVVVEKPMVISADQARAVLAAEAASTVRVHVAFNYRYEAVHREIREHLRSGLIGRIAAVEMSVYTDEIHGSSYFQRWNRRRSESGGLTIHKEGHYLDLLTWWLAQRPIEVFGSSALNYFGPDSEHNPARVDGRYCATCSDAAACAYQRVRAQKDTPDTHATGMQGGRLRSRHLNGQWYSDYRPDACIFDSEIDIEDTYAAVIRYDGGTMVNFSVNFSSPFEQYRIVFNGTRGRLEYGYAFGKEGSYARDGRALVHYPLFGQEPRVIPVRSRPGGHGGADPAMLEDLCSDLDANDRRASSRDGAYAVALGEAMWRSPKEGRPIRIADLLGEWA